MGDIRHIGHFSYHYYSITDVGRVRKNNEDALIEAPEIGLFGVCDGLGGHAAGEVASAMASETLHSVLSTETEDPNESLHAALDTANQRILQEQLANPSQRGMGTTVSALWMVPYAGDGAWIAHLGDSRTYRLRKNRIQQITEDHSPVYRLYKQGILTKDQIQEHPQKNLLERSLGIMTSVEPDVFATSVEGGDIFLICTDGLSDCLKDREIEQILVENPTEDVCQILVDEANRRGGTDNITLLVVEVLEAGGSIEDTR